MTFLTNISTSSEGKRHRSLETFCHHSGMGMTYPHKIQPLIGMCNNSYWDDLLAKVTKFLYSYFWARDNTDTCK